MTRPVEHQKRSRMLRLALDGTSKTSATRIPTESPRPRSPAPPAAGCPQLPIVIADMNRGVLESRIQRRQGVGLTLRCLDWSEESRRPEDVTP